MSLQVCETDKLHLQYTADECLLLIYFMLCLIIFLFISNSKARAELYFRGSHCNTAHSLHDEVILLLGAP